MSRRTSMKACQIDLTVELPVREEAVQGALAAARQVAGAGAGAAE
jgi:hypothetical protein